MVGLRLPDRGHGQQNHAGGQQHVEQQSHRFGEQNPPAGKLVALIRAPPSGRDGVSHRCDRNMGKSFGNLTFFLLILKNGIYKKGSTFLFPQVGKAMSSNETAAYEIMKSLDVDYVLIIFGGVIGYSGDDINKFLWMVRIAEGEHPRDIRVRLAWLRSSFWKWNRLKYLQERCEVGRV